MCYMVIHVSYKSCFSNKCWYWILHIMYTHIIYSYYISQVYYISMYVLYSRIIAQNVYLWCCNMYTVGGVFFCKVSGKLQVWDLSSWLPKYQSCQYIRWPASEPNYSQLVCIPPERNMVVNLCPWVEWSHAKTQISMKRKQSAIFTGELVRRLLHLAHFSAQQVFIGNKFSSNNESQSRNAGNRSWNKHPT